MQLILDIFTYFLIAVLIWHFATRKYLNPYKLTAIVGKKGAGKSTTMMKLIYQHLRKGWRVYTTEHIPGTYHIDYHDIGKYDLPAHSVLFIEEAGKLMNNRKFKEFPEHLRTWLIYQRHEKVKVYILSQSFDFVDKFVRGICDNIYLLTNKLRIFSYGKRILMKPDLIRPSPEANARIADVLQWDSFLFFWCGSRIFTYIPKYAPLFDSYSRLGLPVKKYEYDPPLHVPRVLLPRRLWRYSKHLTPLQRRILRIQRRLQRIRLKVVRVLRRFFPSRPLD